MRFNFRVGGAVSGSVSIIAAKKKSGDSTNNCCSSFVKESLCRKLTTQTVTSAAIIKSNTISPWRNLRISSTPPRSTTGSILAVPTHQLADSPSANEVMTTAIAAGLKICLLLSERIYLEDVASIAAQPRNRRSFGDLAGSMISARMRAVIYADSTLVGAAKMRASSEFAAQHIMTRNKVERSSASGEKGRSVKYDRTAAIATSPIST